MSMAKARDLIIDAIKEDLSVLAAGHPIADLGNEIESLCALFQGLGCSNLLITGDREAFARNLLLSAFGRRYYLRKCRESGVEDALHLAISRTESFFDALVAGRRDVAIELAELSPAGWMPDGEYEDDYCYRAFLHTLVRTQPDPDRDALARLVERGDTVLEGASSPRLTACRALIDGDRDLFVESFEALVDGRQDELAASEVTDDPCVLPRRAIFVEGLALLEVAGMAGWTLEEEYEGCPSLARPTGAPPLPDDLFGEIEEQFARQR